MADRDDGAVADPLPRPTPRQLVIRSIGTLVVLSLLAVGVGVFLDRRDNPTDITDLVEEPRTVSYGRVSLQIPRDWRLNDLDDCGHPQDDTLILGNAGIITCDEGQRDAEASDVVVSSLNGTVVTPTPVVSFSPVTLPSGIKGEIGTHVNAQAESPLRTRVLRLPSLDALVVATSRDPTLIDGIIETVKPVPSSSPATSTVAYLTAALDVPSTWTVNDLRCGVPLSDTVVAGYPGKPRFTEQPGEPCPPGRSGDITSVYLDSNDSEFADRWGPLATVQVDLLGGVNAVRGVKELPDGRTATVVIVPELDSIAVARSADQALVDTVLSTLHRAVPPQPDEEQTAPTPSPDPTVRPTLPAGVETKKLTAFGITLDVPSTWCLRGPTCTAVRPPGASDLVVDRLYSDYGSLWRPAAAEPVTLASGLSGLTGRIAGADGLPVTVLAFPSLDAIVVATAADDAASLDLIDGVLATTRLAATEG